MIACNVRNLGSDLTGVQRYTTELLARAPGDVRVVRPSRPLSGTPGHLWEQLILPGELRRGELLWSPGNSGPLSVGRQVLSLMDMSPLDHPEWMSRKFAAWYGLLLPRLIERVAAIVTISEFSRQRILSYCPRAEGKVHVTHLAADARFRRAGAAQVAEMRTALGIPAPEYFVALGSLEPRKNLSRVLAAWEAIVDRVGKDVWLVLAGAKGKSLVFGDQSFDRLPPRVHLTGHVPDPMLPALYSGAIAALYPSLYEGFGLPPLEAMACGTPVLTSNTTSLPEVTGDAAICVDPLDVEAIAEGLVSLARDSALRDALAARGLEHAARFSWQRTASDTWRLLAQVSGS